MSEMKIGTLVHLDSLDQNSLWAGFDGIIYAENTKYWLVDFGDSHHSREDVVVLTLISKSSLKLVYPKTLSETELILSVRN